MAAHRKLVLSLFVLCSLVVAKRTEALDPPPGTPLAAIVVGPGQYATEPADAIGWMAPGFNMTILAGTYYKPFSIPTGLDGFLIQGACGQSTTIFDGQGGAPDHTLAAGKGFVHTNSPGTIRNIVFQNCGGADGAADGEAGLYAENFAAPGTITADHCVFYFNENGIFVPATGSGNPGNGVAMVVTNSDFVLNGQSGDGQSHDLYVQGDSYTESNCNHYGNPFGNNIKVRSPVLSVTGGYHENNAGSRWIDFPNGGTATVSGGTFVILASSPGGNILGYAEENTDNGVTGGLSFTGGSHLYIGRPNSQMLVASGGTISFASTTLTWTDSGATIVVNGGGMMSGLATSPGSATIGNNPSVPSYVSNSTCTAFNGDGGDGGDGSNAGGDGDGASAAAFLAPFWAAAASFFF